ncbi:MAG: tRNA (cytidine(56)-2'-O)-methyltransferase [Sulfolobales archaeon]
MKQVFVEDLRPRVSVLRLGHRRDRDKRVTTHVALVARAFGAREFILAGEPDSSIRNSVEKILKRWGGSYYFIYRETKDYRSELRNWRESRKNACIVHLTMYGIPIDLVLEEIRDRCEEVLVIVGAEKVPREVYYLADYNISITSQPHSEVSALAVFLDRLYNGEELYLEYRDAEIKIIPSAREKKIVRIERKIE